MKRRLPILLALILLLLPLLTVPAGAASGIAFKSLKTENTGVQDMDACIGQEIRVENGTPKYYGMSLYDTKGNTLASCMNNYTQPNVELWASYDLNFALIPGTTYHYKFFVTVDGVTHWSDRGSFTTQGTNTGSCGEGVSWTLTDVWTLTISGTGAMDDEPEYSPEFEKYLPHITTVVVEEGVTHIGSNAFSRLEKLSKVTLPQTLTSIGSNAFAGQSLLTKLRLPEGLTAIGAGAFSGCSGLGSLTLPAGLTQLSDSLFQGCTQLTAMEIPAGVTSIGARAFADCGKLASVTIPDGVTAIGADAFQNCAALTAEALPGALTSLGSGAFSGCSGLTEIAIPAGVTVLEASTFAYCSKLAAVTLPQGLTRLEEQAFFGCQALTGITLPEGLTAIGNAAFSSCESLPAITLPQSLTHIGESAFYHCASLTEILVPDSVTSLGASAFADCTRLNTITLPSTLTAIPASLLQGTGIPTVTIPEGVTTIGARAFSDSGLTSIVLPVSVTTLEDSVFADCKQLAQVTIPDTITSISSRSFYNCRSLEQISLSSGLTQIEAEAFQGCSKLSTLSIPVGVTQIGSQAFSDCTSLFKIIFEGDAPAIPSDGNTFLWVNAAAYYPEGNETWTADVMQGYGGNLTWTTKGPPCEHSETRIINGQEVSCTQDGYTGDTVCAACGEFLGNGQRIPMYGHNYVRGTCMTCGEKDPSWKHVVSSDRLAGSNRYETAMAAAEHLRDQRKIEKFDTIVVASGANFADALSGSYLAVTRDAPLLLACDVDWINDLVKEFICNNLNPGGTVYILGGTSVIPQNFQNGLEAFLVKRLAGDDRFMTNFLILDEAGVTNQPILVCTGGGFADSLSASATGLPILLVYGDKLTQVQEAFLKLHRSNPIYIIGGTGAVSQALEEQLKAFGTVTRLAGANRFQTSVLIAETFFPDPEMVTLAYAWNYPDGLCGGPVAAYYGSPLLLTMPGYEYEAARYIHSRYLPFAILLGGEGLVPYSALEPPVSTK